MTNTLTKALDALKAKLSDQHGEEFSRATPAVMTTEQEDVLPVLQLYGAGKVEAVRFAVKK